VEVLQSFLRPGDVVLDVGAHLGSHTIAFAHMVGPGGAVHAFEPQAGAWRAQGMRGMRGKGRAPGGWGSLDVTPVRWSTMPSSARLTWLCGDALA
jgi:hypothetical protein